MKVDLMCRYFVVFSLLFFSISLHAQYKVRRGLVQSDNERSVLKGRFSLSKKAIEELTGISCNDQDVPTVGIAMSGGGCRASIASLACLSTLRPQILDATSYLAGLSGSTWTLGSLFTHQYSSIEMKDFLQQALQDSHDFSVSSIFYYLWHKSFVDDQTITLTDIYGCILNKIFLHDLKETARWSDVAPMLLKNKLPIPIFTAVIDNDSSHRLWFEFTPFEAGAYAFNTWIPISCFGKFFNRGVSDDKDEEVTLGFLMGICGSAYAFDFCDVVEFLYYYFTSPDLDAGQNENKAYQVFNEKWEQRATNSNYIEFKERLNVYGARKKLIAETKSLLDRAAWACNPAKGLSDIPYNFGTIDQLKLIDAGVDSNLPLIALLQRKTDLIIICDASAGDKVEGIKELQESVKKAGFSLPPIDYRKIADNQACMFYDKNNAALPKIVYIPLPIDESTLKFTYTKQEFDVVYNAMTGETINAKNKVIEALKIAISHKKVQRS